MNSTTFSQTDSSTAAAKWHWSQWVRQFHRWMAITFTLAVIANLAVPQNNPALWVRLLALFPLALLLLTGLYLFVLPYAMKRRGERRTVEQA